MPPPLPFSGAARPFQALDGVDVMRVSGADLSLDSNGDGSEIVLACMNEGLAPYGFSIAVNERDGSWQAPRDASANFLLPRRALPRTLSSPRPQVSDHKVTLIRFYDGMVIKGGALQEPLSPAGKGGKGGKGGGRGFAAGFRYAPY